MSNDNTKPKTETPKTEIPMFDPMAFWTTSQQTVQKAITDAYGRAQSFAEQYAVIEAQLVARAQGAVASWSQMTQDAIAYAAQLSTEARRLGTETFRKMSVGA